MRATKSIRKFKEKKTEYMSSEAFANLKEAFEGVLAFERGERRDLHVTRTCAPLQAKKVSLKYRKRSEPDSTV